MNKYKDNEFKKIITPLINNSDFLDTKKITHHGITRYEHSLRVAYFSYKITKLLRLDYKETTEAALLHDYFIGEVDGKNQIMKLRKHPEYAVKNAKKYFDITEKQEDIIKTHMFPVTFTPPKYLESWIVDIVDDISAIYEQITSTGKKLKKVTIVLLIIIINFIKFR